MKGLRRVLNPKGGRRFPATRDDRALETTRAARCLLAGRRITVTEWRGVHPAKRQVEVEMVHVCTGPVEAHHVVSKARGGHDRQTVPLCLGAHTELHQRGQLLPDVQLQGVP